MFPRHLTGPLLQALADTPVVFLHGARQTGKSTLVQALATGGHPARYLTLDDAGVLAAARHDPGSFIGGIPDAVILDEVQRAPDLFLAIKAQVDHDRRPGRFLLTGSANVLLLPDLAESLAGRMEVLTLWPLSQGEIDGTREGFLDAVFAETLPSLKGTGESRADIVQRVLRGGYPEVLTRKSEERRSAWFASYITTILQRDVRDLANIEGLAVLPRLLSLLATRATGLLNYSEVSRSLAMPVSTLKRYLALIETTFLVQTLPAWSSNLGARLVKSPKLLLADTGLAAHLLGVEEERFATDLGLIGPLLENFVAMEIRKQSAWSKVRPQLFHYRTQTGQEVDLLLEDRKGRVVGLEVKSGATVEARDFKGLRHLAQVLGQRFHRGLVLYLGREPVAFGDRLAALPVSALWQLNEFEAHNEMPNSRGKPT